MCEVGMGGLNEFWRYGPGDPESIDLAKCRGWLGNEKGLNTV